LIGGRRYKRVPRAYAKLADDPRSRFLLHTGIWAELLCGTPAELASPKLLDYCLNRWKKMLALFDWLADLPRPDPHAGRVGIAIRQ
jgi:hypothetical protein